MKLTPAELEKVAGFFRAFGEPTRLALLQEMKAGERAVGELVEAVPTSQANVSKQLRILHDAGLIRRRKLGTRVLYSIAEARVMDLCRIACDKLNEQTRHRRLSF